MGDLFALVGAAEFADDLKHAAGDLRTRAERHTRDTAIRIADRARVGAPRDRGDLQAAIGWDGSGLSYRVGIRDVTIPSRGGNSAHQNPWVYGVWYEYGFVTRNISTQPFMRPAADAEDARFADGLESLVRDTLGAR